MKSQYSKLLILVLVLVMVLGTGSMVFANEVKDVLQSSEKGLMGDGAMNTIEKLSRDIFNIVRYIVIAYLVIKAFGFFSQFSNAGDNPQLKASLKSRLLWTVGGLVLALNFWNLYNFVADITISFK